MTLTLLQIKNAEAVLNKLLTSPLPVKVSYRLSKIIKKLNEELTQFESSRQKLFEIYGVPNGQGEIVVDEQNRTQFMKELNQLLAESVQLDDIKIPLDDIEDIKFSAVEIAQLEPWIQE
jgi:predicted Abi (CAAX) family protease